MNILCLDYGTKRIGAALSTSPLAEPLGIISNATSPKLTDVVTDQALDQIEKIIREFSIDEILVGISEGAMAEKTKLFINQLKARTTIPIKEVDETLTSVEAGRKVREKKTTFKREKKDHLAAAIMLQDYLDFSAKT